MAKAWGGRFHQATDTRVEAFTESISFDRRLYAVDIRGSMAHATMLASVGLITAEERDQICSHLDQIGEEIAAGQFTFRQDLEDIHMHIETALIRRLDDIGQDGRIAEFIPVGMTEAEARQKLDVKRPLTVGQAQKIAGVTPADVSGLIFHLQHRHAA